MQAILDNFKAGVRAGLEKARKVRYFIDERSGCVAVRDREQTDPEYRGLHKDTVGVVRYWSGEPVQQACPTCGHRISAGWEISEANRRAAQGLCETLNKQGA